MSERKTKLKDELDEINYLIIDSRKLLSILQKIQIQTERTKGWVLGDLFGSGIFTRQSKYQGQNKIKELIKEAEHLCLITKRNYGNKNINFNLKSGNSLIDYFLSPSLASIFQYRKIRVLRNDIIKFCLELEREISMLEKKEEELEIELKKLIG